MAESYFVHALAVSKVCVSCIHYSLDDKKDLNFSIISM